MNRWISTRLPIIVCVAALAVSTIGAIVLFGTGDETAVDDESSASDFHSYVGETEVDEPSYEQPDLDETSTDDIADDDGDSASEATTEEPKSDDNSGEMAYDAEVDEDLGDADATSNDTDSLPATRPAGGSRGQQPTGTIIVVTNFKKASVTVNGDSYPAYSDDGANRGMALPAYETHLVHVEYGDNERSYNVELRPGEERLLMVELTGMNSNRSSPQPERRQRRERSRRTDDDDDEAEDDEGRITVYSRPRGDIYVGSEATNERTPGTIDVDPGRHEVQVEYEDGEMSETKTVRVREGARVKLFFREDD